MLDVVRMCEKMLVLYCRTRDCLRRHLAPPLLKKDTICVQLRSDKTELQVITDSLVYST